MQLDCRINGKTILTGLIGSPVEHTVSPALHNSLFQSMSINGVYVPLKVAKESLKDAVYGLKATGFAGFNVTIPYKVSILDYVDTVTEEVRLLETANTIRIRDGRLYAHNTDGDGFVRAFEVQTGKGFQQQKVCILGAGGTAKSLAVKIALAGAEKICIINRTERKAAELAANVNRLAGQNGRAGDVAYTVESGSVQSLQMLQQCDMIINTTSVGMHPDTGSSPLPDGFHFQKEQVVYDVIYNPTRTKLMKDAAACGCKTVNGAGMLFYQGVSAFEIFMDTTVPQGIVARISTEFLKYLEA